jgi:hypothetical protein
VSLYDDHKDDWQYVENIENVTVTLHSDGDAVVENVKALGRVLSRNDIAMASVIAIGPESKVWNLWASTMPGRELRRGDRIADADGVPWIVASVDLLYVKTRWRAVCNKAT